MHRDGNKRSVFANIADICKKMHRWVMILLQPTIAEWIVFAHRQPEHVIQFLFAEMGTTGSVDGSGRLVIKGRFQQKQIENILRRYIGQFEIVLCMIVYSRKLRLTVEYVTCKTCKSPDTLLEKDNRIYFVTCQSYVPVFLFLLSSDPINRCQSRRSVSSITSGFKALTSKRFVLSFAR